MKKRLLTLVMIVCSLGAFSQTATLIVKPHSYFERYPLELRQESPYNMVGMPQYIETDGNLTITIDIPNKKGSFFRFYTSMVIYLTPGATLTLDYNPREYFKSKFEGDLACENTWLNSVLLNNPPPMALKDGEYFRTNDFSAYADNVAVQAVALNKSLDNLGASDYFVKNMRNRIDFMMISSYSDFIQTLLMQRKQQDGLDDEALTDIKQKYAPEIEQQALKVFKKHTEDEVIATRQGCFSLASMAMLNEDFLKNLDYKKFNDIYRYAKMTEDLNSMLTPEFLVYAKSVKDKVLKDRVDAFLKQNKHMFAGEIPKDVEFEDLDGNKCKLSDFKGSVIYIDFWATWCNPCKALSPYYAKLAERMKGHNVKFLAVSIDSNTAIWKRYMNDNSHSESVTELYCGDKEFIKWFAINSIPRFIMIDKNFKIKYAYALKPFEQSHEEIIKILEELE